MINPSIFSAHRIMNKLLLTAFEPFDGKSINSSLEMAKSFDGKSFPDLQVDFIELPVVHNQASEIAIDHILTTQPDVVMMLGTAKGRFCITPERVAINMDYFDIPDNAGNQPQGSPIIDEGPVGYFSSLPVDTLVTRLKEAHIPAAISNTAGLYLCNQLFYSVMHCITANQMSTRAGFIHLPYLDEQTVNEKQPLPGMSRETMMKAVHIAIETSVQV